jgi:hypothetical protein
LEAAAREFESELAAQRTKRRDDDVKVLSREQDQFLERCWREFQATHKIPASQCQPTHSAMGKK